MSRFGAALAGQKPLQPLLLELRLSLVNRGAGQPELPGGFGNRAVLGFHRPQGFVFELEQILRIEKGGLLKQGVAHQSGTGIKGAGGL